MPSLTSELFVRLIDGVTRPAAAVSRAITGIGRAQANVNNMPLGQRMAEAAERNRQQLDAARGSMVDAAAAGYALARALSAPIGSAMEFETQLEDIGQKANIPQERLGALGKQIRTIGQDTNQAASDIANAVDTLVGMGASEEVALAAASPIGMAATAYRAASEDLASASYAAVENLKVPADQIGSALDAMAEAGKQGAFELRDMAQYFPSLGAAYQGLGQSGVDAVADLAAALQVVRKGTGDSSTAATNLGNVLQKIYAPGTVKKFKAAGVDIFDAMAKAAERGLTPIEAIAELTEKTLKGDLSKMGTLFEDAQVQSGMRALIQNMEEYRRIREEAMKAQGVVAADFERRMNTAAMASSRWRALTENLSVAIGSALLPALNDTVAAVSPVILQMTKFAEANPELTRNIIAATSALIGFRVAAIGVRWAALFMRGGILSVVGPIVRTGEAAKRAATSAIALQTALARGAAYSSWAKAGTAFKAIAMAAPGMSAFGAAIGTVAGALSAPVILGIAAVAGAGMAIYKYWDRISAVFTGVGRALAEQFSPAIEAVKPYLEWLSPIGEKIAAGWDLAKQALSAFGEWIGSFFTREVLTDEQAAQWEMAGYDAANRMVEAVKSAIGKLVDWFTGLPGMILDAIGSIDLGSLIKWPSPPAWLSRLWGGGTVEVPAPADPEKRATGGPVKRGRNYVVGDGGEPEFFTPGADGFITPFSKVEPFGSDGGGRGGRSAGGSGAARAPIHFAPQWNQNAPIYGVDDLERRFEEFSARQRDAFESLMAGSFSDTGDA